MHNDIDRKELNPDRTARDVNAGNDMDRNKSPLASVGYQPRAGQKKSAVLVVAFLVFIALLSGAGVYSFQGEYGQAFAGDAENPDGRKILYYVSPMDPEFKSDKPGKAPCGMDLVPVYEGEEEAASAPQSVSTPQPASAAQSASQPPSAAQSLSAAPSEIKDDPQSPAHSLPAHASPAPNPVQSDKETSPTPPGQPSSASTVAQPGTGGEPALPGLASPPATAARTLLQDEPASPDGRPVAQRQQLPSRQPIPPRQAVSPAQPSPPVTAESPVVTTESQPVTAATPPNAPSGTAKTGETGRKILYYVDPMNPTQKSDKPGKAPCGMDLVPVYEEESSATAAALPPGTVRISPQKQQLIGIKLGEVAEQPLSRKIRTVGRVAIDETKIVRVHPGFSGWVKKAHVDFTGKPVVKGDPLVTISSPDFVSAQQELLIAKRSVDSLKSSSIAGLGARAASFHESSRQRLRAMNVGDELIAEIEGRSEPLEMLTLRSPIDGLVLARHAYEGQHVTSEKDLYELVDVSTIWVLADIYEYEMAMVREGQPVTVSLPYLPGQVLEGRIDFIAPKLDPKSRTLKVRIELPNPGLELKPDMYANVDFEVDHGTHLAVDADAVLDSGSVQTVFVSRDGGYFEPRRVKLGRQVNGSYIVLDGLKAGERVVTSANFLIDSESQIKTGLSGMAANDGSATAEKVEAVQPAAAENTPETLQPAAAESSPPAQERAGRS